MIPRAVSAGLWVALLAAALALLAAGGAPLVLSDLALDVNVNVDSMFTECQPASGEWEMIVALAVGDYPTPCSQFYYLWQPSDEFYNLIQLNNYGLHDTPLTLEKPSDVYRILILGDDATQALEVPLEQGYAFLVEQQLNRVAGRKIEVVNMSVTDFGTDRALILYSVFGAAFKPDVVLLAFNMADDLVNNQFELESLRRGSRLSRAFFTMQNGTLTLHDSQLLNPRDVGLSEGSWFITMQGEQTRGPGPSLPKEPHVVEEKPVYKLSYPVQFGMYFPEDRYWAEAWALTESFMPVFRDVVEQTGARFGVIILPDKFHIDSATSEQIHVERMLKEYPPLVELGFADADLAAPPTRLEAYLRGLDIPTVNLDTTLYKAQRDDRANLLYYYYWDHHLNVSGHVLIAERVANWLIAEGLVPLE